VTREADQHGNLTICFILTLVAFTLFSLPTDDTHMKTSYYVQAGDPS